MNIKPKYVEGDTVFYIKEQRSFPILEYAIVKGKVLGFYYSTLDKPKFIYKVLSGLDNESEKIKKAWADKLLETELFDNKKEASARMPKKIEKTIASIKKSIANLTKIIREDRLERNKRMAMYKKKLNRFYKLIN